MNNTYINREVRVKEELEKLGILNIQEECLSNNFSFDFSIVNNGKIISAIDIIGIKTVEYVSAILSNVRNQVASLPFIKCYILVISNEKSDQNIYYDFTDEVIWNKEINQDRIRRKLDEGFMDIEQLKALHPYLFKRENSESTMRKIKCSVNNWYYWLLPLIILIIGLLDSVNIYSLNMERLFLLITFLISLILFKIEEIRVGNLNIKLRENRRIKGGRG